MFFLFIRKRQTTTKIVGILLHPNLYSIHNISMDILARDVFICDVVLDVDRRDIQYSSRFDSFNRCPNIPI